MSSAVTPSPLLERLIRNFKQRTPLRTGSLIVTIFGDCISPRGGVVWLGSLINVLAPLEISQRLVRTAVYRLVQDGILDNEQVGRKSFYTLTREGRQSFAEATDRIYRTTPPDWDGSWCIVFLNRVPVPARMKVRKDLQWLGFGAFASDVMAHPRPDTDLLATHLRAIEHGSRAIVMQASLQRAGVDTNVADLVGDTWHLDDLEQAYAGFVSQFESFLAAGTLATIGPTDAFYLRTFLIHEYRKVLLRDPALPDELLPESWQGRTAQQLTQAIYRQTLHASEAFIEAHFQDQSGPLPPPDEAFFRRFND